MSTAAGGELAVPGHTAEPSHHVFLDKIPLHFQRLHLSVTPALCYCTLHPAFRFSSSLRQFQDSYFSLLICSTASTCC